jgi:hypothetical protein
MGDPWRTDIVSTHMAFWAFIAGVIFALGGMALDASPSTIADAEVQCNIL